MVDGLVSMNWIESAETPGLSIGTLLAFGALIGMPVIFAVGGLLLGLVELVLYQLLYRWLPGIDLDFLEKD